MSLSRCMSFLFAIALTILASCALARPQHDNIDMPPCRIVVISPPTESMEFGSHTQVHYAIGAQASSSSSLSVVFRLDCQSSVTFQEDNGPLFGQLLVNDTFAPLARLHDEDGVHNVASFAIDQIGAGVHFVELRVVTEALQGRKILATESVDVHVHVQTQSNGGDEFMELKRLSESPPSPPPSPEHANIATDVGRDATDANDVMSILTPRDGDHYETGGDRHGHFATTSRTRAIFVSIELNCDVICAGTHGNDSCDVGVVVSVDAVTQFDTTVRCSGFAGFNIDDVTEGWHRLDLSLWGSGDNVHATLEKLVMRRTAAFNVAPYNPHGNHSAAWSLDTAAIYSNGNGNGNGDAVRTDVWLRRPEGHRILVVVWCGRHGFAARAIDTDNEESDDDFDWHWAASSAGGGGWPRFEERIVAHFRSWRATAVETSDDIHWLLLHPGQTVPTWAQSLASNIGANGVVSSIASATRDSFAALGRARHLSPRTVSERFEFVVVTDVHLHAIDTGFDLERMLGIVRDNGLHVAAPAVLRWPRPSVDIPVTLIRRDRPRAGVRWVSALPVSPITVFSSRAWACIAPMLRRASQAESAIRKQHGGKASSLPVGAGISQLICRQMCDCGICDSCGVVDDTPVQALSFGKLGSPNVDIEHSLGLIPALHEDAKRLGVTDGTWWHGSNTSIEHRAVAWHEDMMVLLARSRWFELCTFPNTYAPSPTAIASDLGGLNATGIESFAISSKGVVETNDVSLTRQTELVNTVIAREGSDHGTYETLGVVGGSLGYHAVRMVLQGQVQSAVVIDADAEYEAPAADLLDIAGCHQNSVINGLVSSLSYTHVKLSAHLDTDSSKPLDLVLAFGVVHWMATCTEDNGGVHGVIGMLRALTGKVALIEWVPRSDPHPTNYETLAGLRSEYNLEAFRRAIQHHFACAIVVGATTGDRLLFEAHTAQSTGLSYCRHQQSHVRSSQIATPQPYNYLLPGPPWEGAPVPIFIIVRDRLTVLKRTLDNFRATIDTPHEIIIHDNNSTYPPLLEFLDSLRHNGTRVYRVGGNFLLSIRQTIQRYFDDSRSTCQYYVVTDPDIELHGRGDMLSFYRHLLDMKTFLTATEDIVEAECVGPMLRKDDVPDSYPLKGAVLGVDYCTTEKGFPLCGHGSHANVDWRGEQLQVLPGTPIDTTFAMYRRGWSFKRYCDSVRTYAPYDGKHLDWYIDVDDMPQDAVAYFNQPSAAEFGHWSSASAFTRALPSVVAASPWRVSLSGGQPITITGSFPHPAGYHPINDTHHPTHLLPPSLTAGAWATPRPAVCTFADASSDEIISHTAPAFADASIVVCFAPPSNAARVMHLWLSTHPMQSRPTRGVLAIVATDWIEKQQTAPPSPLPSTSTLPFGIRIGFGASFEAGWLDLRPTTLHPACDDSATNACQLPLWPSEVPWRWSNKLTAFPTAGVSSVMIGQLPHPAHVIPLGIGESAMPTESGQRTHAWVTEAYTSEILQLFQDVFRCLVDDGVMQIVALPFGGTATDDGVVVDIASIAIAAATHAGFDRQGHDAWTLVLRKPTVDVRTARATAAAKKAWGMYVEHGDTIREFQADERECFKFSCVTPAGEMCVDGAEEGVVGSTVLPSDAHTVIFDSNGEVFFDVPALGGTYCNENVSPPGEHDLSFVMVGSNGAMMARKDTRFNRLPPEAE